MRNYKVSYRMYNFSAEKSISILAENKADAYSKAYFDEIPKVEGEMPYSAWVDGYVTKSGKLIYFNTCDGFPY